MEHFELPHDHGEKSHTAALCRELGKTGHFAAVSDVFKQLSDSNRVRIFWLLSHQEACVVNIAAMLEMSSPAVSHHLRSLAESGLLESRRGGEGGLLPGTGHGAEPPAAPDCGAGDGDCLSGEAGGFSGHSGGDRPQRAPVPH